MERVLLYIPQIDLLQEQYQPCKPKIRFILNRKEMYNYLMTDLTTHTHTNSMLLPIMYM